MKNDRRPAKLKDIADRLGISVATVSRALQSNPAISKQTRELVMQTARDMNYTKNIIADSLRSGSLPVIGVIVPHAVTHFYSSVLDGIEHVAAAAGYAVVSMNSHERYFEECANVRNLANLHVAGIIASVTQETDDFSHFDCLKDNGIPVVFVARDIPVHTYSSVTADGAEASFRATRHLIEQGCRRIAMLCGPSRLKMVKERKHGYIEALREHGLPLRPEYVAYSDIDSASAIDTTEELLDLKERPDAIIALNDTLLFSAMKTIKRRGLSMPSDIAVIGFSDAEYVADVCPTLSTIEDQSRMMGESVAQILLNHIRGDVAPVRKIIPTVQRIRQSSKRV